MTTARRLIDTIETAMPHQIETLRRRVAIADITVDERADARRALAEREAHFASPEWLGKIVRSI